RDALVDVDGGGILDRDAGCHQLGGFVIAHDSAHCRQLDAAVDASNFIGIRDGDGLHNLAALPVDGDQIGQVILVLRVLGGNTAHGVEQSIEREGVNA